ncbi:hypothetical protein PoB_006656800 [Plakobranchus ocellatus]|uniref:Uncharacterized protein n=1 Tax=Plakobranchus ocellatus TaxID=259542 RepID=A0AAV4D769_9GAST|nr:hypothetical protein PoB_006656800 [Plakobranchus ocellatus]
MVSMLNHVCYRAGPKRRREYLQKYYSMKGHPQFQRNAKNSCRQNDNEKSTRPVQTRCLTHQFLQHSRSNQPNQVACGMSGLDRLSPGQATHLFPTRCLHDLLRLPLKRLAMSRDRSRGVGFSPLLDLQA